MVVGAIRQMLRVRTFGPNLQMHITDVRFNNAGGNWWPCLLNMTPKLGIHKNNLSDSRQELPLRVDKSWRDGQIGEAYLSSMSASDSGKGPDIMIDFKVTGSVDVGNGKTASLDENGSIKVSTSDWGSVSRADWCKVKYQLNGGSSYELGNKISWQKQPSDVGFVLGYSVKDRMLGINASTDGGALGELERNVKEGKLEGNGAGWSSVNV